MKPKNKKPTNLYEPQKLFLVTTNVKVLLTVLSGLVVGLLGYYIVEQGYDDNIAQRASVVSSLIDKERVASVKANDADASESRAYLSSQLQAAALSLDDTNYAYILTIDSTNKVSVLASTDPSIVPNGEVIQNAQPEIVSGFFSRQVMRLRPLNHAGGGQISVLAPVIDNNGQVIALAGFDMSTTTYYNILFVVSAAPVLATLLMSLIFVINDNARRRRAEGLRMRSELVSIASHELRTPLTGIRWGEESLLGSKLAEKPKETVKSMYDSTLHLQESIEDILQLANWQAGRNQELVKTSTDLHAMLSGIFATQKLPALQKNVTLELSGDWPEKAYVNCDAQRMKRVLNNLVSNAIKYSRPHTAVTVSYEKIDGQHVLGIKDEGIGIPKAEQEKVFQGFYRASNAVSHETSGTGMGLYMSRSTVEQHGGKLWLKSTEGKGTTVFLRLP